MRYVSFGSTLFALFTILCPQQMLPARKNTETRCVHKNVSSFVTALSIYIIYTMFSRICIAYIKSIEDKIRVF